ncbi:hypothetical protein GGU10DRAFT_384002 [Lentinula aff. detonsa]|uniref:Uncharacterized protein n=1 Tax=Lentinula aff. detonsa TaxID=2804958 RepID=A0AA38TYK9_9AGAR|nr:hypothetical protein GGU10DRAFT_384002 [Lentinula aff. detonsa]
MDTKDILSVYSATPRPRRKPKAPKGILGAKLKSRAAPKPQSTRNFSPLPPSSPFASSSQFTQDLLPVAATSEAQTHDIGKRFFEEVEVDEDRDFESDAYGTLEGEVGVQETVDYAEDSDPFGFFALEAKLKAERTQRSISAATLPAPFAQSLKVPPRSPHKARIRKSFMTESGRKDVAKGDSPSLPSSPSPAKPRRATKRGLAKGTNSDKTEREHSQGDGNNQDIDHPHGQLQYRAKTQAGGRRKQPINDKSVDPEKLARDLKALLPKRATRRNGKRPIGSDSDEVEHETHRGVKRGKQGKNNAGDDEMDAERQKRLDYFKKLESYKVAKENVYVI